MTRDSGRNTGEPPPVFEGQEGMGNMNAAKFIIKRLSALGPARLASDSIANSPEYAELVERRRKLQEESERLRLEEEEYRRNNPPPDPKQRTTWLEL